MSCLQAWFLTSNCSWDLGLGLQEWRILRTTNNEAFELVCLKFYNHTWERGGCTAVKLSLLKLQTRVERCMWLEFLRTKCSEFGVYSLRGSRARVNITITSDSTSIKISQLLATGRGAGAVVKHCTPATTAWKSRQFDPPQNSTKKLTKTQPKINITSNAITLGPRTPGLPSRPSVSKTRCPAPDFLRLITRMSLLLHFWRTHILRGVRIQHVNLIESACFLDIASACNTDLQFST